MKKLPIIILFSITMFAINFVLFAQNDKNTIFKNLIAKYGKINTISVVFDGENMKNCHLKAKKGNKYNIKIGGNNIISDGKTIWNYNKNRKNVVISDFIPEMNGLSLDYFFFTVLENLEPISLKTELSTSNKKRYLLELQCKDKTQEIQKVNLFLNDNFSKITAIEITAGGENQKWFIKNLEINKTISDTNFTFKTPKNVEEIRL